MSKDSWNHAICADCWFDQRGFRVPTRVRDADLETCCYCSTLTKAGIYTRDDPKEVHRHERRSPTISPPSPRRV